MSMVICGFQAATSKPLPQVQVTLYRSDCHRELSYRGEIRRANPKAKPLPDGYGEK